MAVMLFLYVVVILCLVLTFVRHLRQRKRKGSRMSEDDPQSITFKLGYFLYVNTPFGRFYHNRNIRKAERALGEGGHSAVKAEDLAGCRVTALPLVEDNLAYVVENTSPGASGAYVLIDPSDADKVYAHLAQMVPSEESARVPRPPDAILTTHKHWDHAGGNAGLRRLFPRLQRVIGGVEDSPDSCTELVSDGQEFEAAGLSFTALHTPGHTAGHIVYLLRGQAQGPDSLFSGDFLFLGGLGQMYEGTGDTMAASIDKVRGACRPDTLVWPGHEYTKTNLSFASLVEPSNERVAGRLIRVKALRRDKQPTCPGTLAEEYETNVFLRGSEPEVQAYARDQLAQEGVSVPPGDQPVPPGDVQWGLRLGKNLFAKEQKRRAKEEKRQRSALCRP